jgi:tetratricopeptide (TPR) repeat protein
MFDFNEELGLLRHAVAEPVRQLILVEYARLPRLHQALHELAALVPRQAHIIHKFDFRTDTTASLLHEVREKLATHGGSRPAFLALVGPDQIDPAVDTPASQQFWKEMNQAREALNALDAQILLCVESWSFRQAVEFADHLLSWAAMRIHLVEAPELPVVLDRPIVTSKLLSDLKITPALARERLKELEQSLARASASGEPMEGFLQRFFIPMLEAALACGDLVLARQTCEHARSLGQLPDADLPRWHELNLILAVAEHELDLAEVHGCKLIELAEKHPDERVRNRALIAVNKQAVLLFDTAHYAIAEPLLRKSLKIAENTYGASHPEVAIRLNNLAQLLKATHRLAEAEPLMRRALKIDEASYGPEHPTVAAALNNLALLLQARNRLGEAEPLMRRALKIAESSYGPDHPTVAIFLNNLAQLLKATHRLAEAEPLMRRALKIAESSYGPDHPDVARDLNNLAQLLKATHRLAEAEPLMRRALKIAEASYGPNHHDVATNLNNLAVLLQDTNRLAEAEPLMRRALKIAEASYGPDHPAVATDLNNLAQLLKDTHRLAEAEPLLRRALKIAEASFGPDHPDVATYLNNLAWLLQDSNRLAEAEPLSRRQLKILFECSRATGHDHPHLETGIANYSRLLQAMGKSHDQIKAALQALAPDRHF